jgi:uncharacterized membrane protein YphA (DoxX/SURF4 family)
MRQAPNKPHIPVVSGGRKAGLSFASAASWSAFAIRIVGALIWILSGTSKLPDLGGFAVQVDRYQLLPHTLGAMLAYTLPFLEIFLGLYLGAGLFIRATAFVGTILFAAFLAFQIQALIRGLTFDCGCFGTFSKTTLGPWTLLRDLALGLPTFIMLALPARKFSLDSRLFGASDGISANS